MYVLLLLVGFSAASYGVDNDDAQLQDYAGSPGWAQSKEQRLTWHSNVKFGMFIHWGLYAPAGGYWPPNPNTGKKHQELYSEWIRTWAKVDEPEYGNLTKPLFKPAQGVTDEWAKLAKDAGMKYAVLTTKHHDGYTLFNAKAPYSVSNPITSSTNISPSGRDLVAEYSHSMKKHGLKLGYYYSLIDWQHPDALPHMRHWPLATNAKHSRYTEYMHGHIDQLLSDYGQVDVLWVDYSSEKYQGQSWQTRSLLDAVRKKQPKILINNRFWHGLDNRKGDFFTPEKRVPATGFPGQSFEVCHTMNESFGYSHHDNKWKSSKDVIHLLIDIVSKGGNLLLNVGPDAQGHIPTESAVALRGVGKWLKKYGESIYQTQANPFNQLSFDGRITQKISAEGDTILYLHLMDWPKNKNLELIGLKNTILSAGLIGGAALKTTLDERGVQIALPAQAADKESSVIKLVVKGKLEINQ